MSRSRRKSTTVNGRQRHISVRAARRDSPDMRRLGRAIVAIALAQAEADAEAQAATSAKQNGSVQPNVGGDDV
jgi:hypothetical protein